MTIQAQILELIKAMQKKYDLTTIYITHDLGVVANVADRIAVMYAGDLVEIGVDCINPMMVKNDIDGIMEQYGDKITIMGGVDNQPMELAGTPEAVTKAVREAMDKYVNKGRYLPFIIPIRQETFGMYIEAVNEYGRQIEVK